MVGWWCGHVGASARGSVGVWLSGGVVLVQRPRGRRRKVKGVGCVGGRQISGRVGEEGRRVSGA